jgi:hypothetical protein
MGGDLAGYDGKIWSGLLSDHYAPLWEMLLEAMRTEAAGGAKIDAASLGHKQWQFSSNWVRQTNAYPTTPSADNGDPVEAAKVLIAKYAPDPASVAEDWDKVAATEVAVVRKRLLHFQCPVF